ncbi:hypothetical protein XENTR_v10023384, partial [Xenopus tropicalis]
MGGQNSTPGKWPWQVSIRDAKGTHFCGGTLIDNKTVISAAHCFSNTNDLSSIVVFLGSYMLSEPNQQEIRVAVMRIIVHPRYDKYSSINDISLLELENEVVLTDAIIPVCLPTAAVTFPTGLKCWATGWGAILPGADPPSPRVLREVEVKMMSNDRCNTLFNIPDAYGRTTANLTDTMLCAGYAKGGRDSCNGDVGGPLVCPKDGRWYLAGVVSGGDGCGKPNRPGIYTRVSSYIKWITGVAPEV